MKRSMLNVFRVGFFSLVALFSFSIVEAEEKETINIDPDKYIRVLDSSIYEGAVCTSDKELEDYFEIIHADDGSYWTRLKLTAEGKSYTGYLDCSYSRKITDGTLKGKITYTFSYKGELVSGKRTIFTELLYDYAKETGFNVVNGSGLHDFLNKGLNIYDVSIDSDSEKYIGVNECKGNSCIVSVKDEAKNLKEVKKVTFTFKYSYVDGGVTRSDNEAIVEIRLRNERSVIINTGNYAKCSLSADWKQIKPQVNESYGTVFRTYDSYYQDYENTVTFPNCSTDWLDKNLYPNDEERNKYSQNPLIEFVGWSPSDKNSAVLDSCNEPIIKGGESVNPKDYYNFVGTPKFSACYKSVTGYTLVVDDGDIPEGLQGEYIKQTKNISKKVNAYKKKVDSAKVVLPTAIHKDGYEFLGWNENNSAVCNSDNTSGCIRAGIEIDAKKNVTYYAVFAERKTSNATNVYDVVLVKGNTSRFVLAGSTLESCKLDKESDSAKVGITGTCILLGREVTDDDEIIKINAKDTSGVEYVINVRVVSGIETSEVDMSSHTYTVKLPNFTDAIGGGDQNSGSVLSGLTCDAFNVTRANEGTRYLFFADDRGEGESNSTDFRAKSKCGDGTEYSALCLDPGRLGPNKYGANNGDYVIKRRLNPSDENNKFDRGAATILKYITEKAPTTDKLLENQPLRAAANIAIRMMAFKYGENDSCDTSRFTSHCQYYKSMSDKWYGAKDKSINTVKGLANWGGSIGDATSEQLFGILSSEQTCLDSKNSGTDACDFSDYTDEIKNSPEKGSYENGKLILDGTIELPKGATINASNIKLKCPSYISESKCKLGNVGSPNESYVVPNGSTFDYHVVLDIPDSVGEKRNHISNDCSSSDGLCFIFNYNPSSNHIPISGAAIIEPAGGNSLQRLVIFAPGEANARVPLYNKKDKTDVCKFPDDGSDEEWRKFFEELDCCAYVTDHSSRLYQKYCLVNQCLVSNYNLACEVSEDGYGNSRDDYHVYEASRLEDNGEIKSDYTCVVDIETGINGRAKTTQLSDAKGNSYSLEDYKNNQYCRVSCFEAWDFSMAGFKDFVGQDGAKAAGTSFQINEDVYLSGKRTCVTTYIDYNQYLKDVGSYSAEMLDQWNGYSSRSQTYYNLENTHNNSVKTWYYYGKNDEYVEYEEDSYCGWSGDWTLIEHAEYCDDRYDEDIDGDGVIENLSCVNDGTGYYNDNGTWIIQWAKKYQNANKCWRVSNSNAKTNQCNIFNISSSGSYESYDASGNYSPKSLSSVEKNTPDPVEGTPVSKGKYYENGYIYFDEKPVSGQCYTDGNGDNVADKDPKWYYDELLATVKYPGDENLLKAAIDSYKKGTNMALGKLQGAANAFYKCQNFSIRNTEDVRGASYQHDSSDSVNNFPDNNAYRVDNNSLESLGLYSYTGGAYTVVNGFRPRMSYGYDDEIYNSMIPDEDRILVYNKDYNYKGDKDNAGKDIAKGTCYTYKTNVIHDLSDGTEEKIPKEYEICNNKYESISYNVDTSWNVNKFKNFQQDYGNGDVSDDSVAGQDYANMKSEEEKIALCAVSDTAPYARNAGTKNSGGCVTATVYYRKANYIKQSVKNSGYFSNKGNWYISVTGIKTHQDSKADALDAYPQTRICHDAFGKKNGEDCWSVFGTNHNVFPISLTTRRNIYQYAYFFNDIGVYNSSNNHRSLSVGRIMNLEGNSLIGYNTHACFYEIKEELCRCCSDEPINVVIDNDVSSVSTKDTVKKVANVEYHYSSDKPRGAGEGTLGFYNSTVSLNKLDSGTGRKLGTNWTSAGTYTYDGKNYTTSKGDLLLKAIEAAGEKIYDENPEYSYTLSPSALAELRNFDRDYGIDYNRLSVYSVFIDNSKEYNDQNWATVPMFQHMVNNVLTVDFGDWITPGYSDLLTSVNSMDKKNCVVYGKKAGSVATARELVRKCRFVDYIDEQNGNEYRLAFK